MVMIQESKIYQAYYTKSTPIVNYMVDKLSLKGNDNIFEPCGGDGVFVEAILENNDSAKIDVCELNIDSYNILQAKFSRYQNVRIRQCDTLLDSDLFFNSNFGGAYDKIIANPPYGAWQDYDKREKLKKLFPNLYAKETYALFLFRSIELLKAGGILSFIIPDTFLNLHMHKALRKHILTKTKILELVLIPSSFFPGVNFGYANLSIISLEKCNIVAQNKSHFFPIISGFSKAEELNNIEKSRLRIHNFLQSDILANPDHAFFVAENSEIVETINNSSTKLGDVANCVTGFYSGDDKRFLKVINTSLKNGKNYEVICSDSINHNYRHTPNILDGIDSNQCFLPIVKGGNIKYLKPQSWFMNWSKEAVKHYRSDKKARFQNSQYYFRFGIGVPMVSSTSITASLIEYQLFDQSIVGIFPKEEFLTYYLLGYLNSPTCNKLIRTINPSANNPANYIKKIPFIYPETDTMNLISTKVREIVDSIKKSGTYQLDTEQEIQLHFKELYGF